MKKNLFTPSFFRLNSFKTHHCEVKHKWNSENKASEGRVARIVSSAEMFFESCETFHLYATTIVTCCVTLIDKDQQGN